MLVKILFPKRVSVFLLTFAMTFFVLWTAAIAAAEPYKLEIEDTYSDTNPVYTSIGFYIDIYGVTVSSVESSREETTTTEPTGKSWPTYTYTVNLGNNTQYGDVITLKATYTGIQATGTGGPFPKVSVSRERNNGSDGFGAGAVASPIDNGAGQTWTVKAPVTTVSFYVYTNRTTTGTATNPTATPKAQYKLKFVADSVPPPGNYVVDAEIMGGQFIYKPYLLDANAYEVPSLSGAYTEKGIGKIAAPHGVTDVQARLQIQDAVNTKVYVREQEQSIVDGKCVITLPASIDGTETTVTLKIDGADDNAYKFICYSSRYAGTPDGVRDYLAIGGQYVNGGNQLNPYVGINAVGSILGLTGTGGFAGTTSLYLHTGPTSLGGFGGYVTYYYENAIIDNPNNPYGVDFIVFGNSENGGSNFAEPANVLVSEDGATWYNLAGSRHYDDETLWDYAKTYTNSSGQTTWRDNYGNSGSLDYPYPQRERYPLFAWTTSNESTITLTGVNIGSADGENAFGYADVGKRGNTAAGEMLDMNNIAGNPYEELRASENYTYVDRTDGFDLAWAVDENGQPVTFANGVHYIKIQTATGVVEGATGEKSPEVNLLRTAQSNEGAVGKTGAPGSITVDGRAVTISEANVIHNVLVFGTFVVNVDAPAANVYINSVRGGSAVFTAMPNHRMLRVIVQEGQKEPWIGYLNLVEGEPDEGDRYSEVTFDPAGGALTGPLTRAYMPELSDGEKVFPIPAYQSREFLGWYDAAGERRESYDPSMPAALTLTARWKYILSEGEKPRINVTFRLIGAKRSSGAVDLTGNNPAGYNGADYVTWIATKSYTMSAGDTNYDLFVRAVNDAGLQSTGSDQNYVSAIWAPSSLGGYKLAETTNGQFSGWMYTVNGRHPGRGLREFDLHDGDEVIWHYVNDYRYEIADWFDDQDYPALGDGSLHNRWLLASDVETGKLPGEGGPSEGSKPGSLPGGAIGLLPNGVEAAGDAAALFDVAEGEGVNDVLDWALPGLNADERAMFSVNGATGLLEANTWAVISGVSEETAKKLAPSAPSLPIPTFEADVTPGKTVLVTLNVNLGEFAGHAISELAVLKLKRGGVTEELARSAGFEGMTDGRFIITDLDGVPVPVTSQIEAREYLLSVAIADNGAYDWNPADGHVFDPLAVTLYGDQGGKTGDADDDGDGRSEASGGGCDAGFAPAGAALALALRRKRR